ncbi:MAG TPA: SBBP repeat-containing protein, partial [Candidatus Binataceae bacterium]|nr:SBBP repeat-containing protein [Candidatus Binataceae bacterium]
MILVTARRSRFQRFATFVAALAMVLMPLLDGLAYAVSAPLECSASNPDSDAVVQFREALANPNSARDVFKRVRVVADALPLSPEPSARISGPTSSGPAALAKPARIVNPRRRAIEQLGRMPLVFVENRGQAAPEVEFYTHLESATVGLTNDGLLFDLTRQLPKPAYHGGGASPKLGAPASGPYQRAQIHQRLVDPNRLARLEADLQTPGEFNYLIGSNPAHWHRHLKTYRMLVWRDVWKGTNLRLYGRDGGLEQAFVVSPQADPARIHFALSGARALSIDRDGSLAIDTAAGTLRERKPLAYQDIAGKRVAVAASFRLDGRGGYGFGLGDYDHGRPLIIDPALIFSTYLGGVHDDAGFDIAADPVGNVYVSGATASQNFPVSANAYQTMRSDIGSY